MYRTCDTFSVFTFHLKSKYLFFLVISRSLWVLSFETGKENKLLLQSTQKQTEQNTGKCELIEGSLYVTLRHFICALKTLIQMKTTRKTTNPCCDNDITTKKCPKHLHHHRDSVNKVKIQMWSGKCACMGEFTVVVTLQTCVCACMCVFVYQRLNGVKTPPGCVCVCVCMSV